VFHLAGYSHDLRDASKVKHVYHAVNVLATVKLAELAVQHGVLHFVFVSSVKAGGSTMSGKRMAGSDQVEPEGMYGQIKREAELKVWK
jgi:UDP-glucose 4-epimerase